MNETSPFTGTFGVATTASWKHRISAWSNVSVEPMCGAHRAGEQSSWTSTSPAERDAPRMVAA